MMTVMPEVGLRLHAQDPCTPEQSMIPTRICHIPSTLDDEVQQQNIIITIIIIVVVVSI